MDLQDAVNINRKILHLIESKHELPPSTWGKGPELTYYTQLLRNTAYAVNALKHGGIVVPPDTDS